MTILEAAKAPFVICSNLVKIYKVADLEVVALQGLDLEIPQGEILAVVGPSGSGKSSLLNILGGLDRPTAGRITVGGVDLLKLSEAALTRYRRETVGFVWQQTGRNLIPYLTAQQNVELPMLMAGKPPRHASQWASELLDAVGLGQRRKHRLAQLSGGEQQRVAIALALANRPQLLLADEPTGEVDAATARGIWQVFRDVRTRYGLTTVIVTHDPNIAQEVDRVVSIRDGKTSTETVRQTAEVTAAACAPAGQQGEEEGAGRGEHTYNEYVGLDSAGRLQVPRAYLKKWGIGTRATLELTEEGILIRPIGPAKETQAERPDAEAVGVGNLYGEEDLPPVARQPWLVRRLTGLRGRSAGR